MSLFRTRRLAATLTTACALALGACAQELNLYSARHYQTDEALYSDSPRPRASGSTASTLTMPASWPGCAAKALPARPT